MDSTLRRWTNTRRPLANITQVQSLDVNQIDNKQLQLDRASEIKPNCCSEGEEDMEEGDVKLPLLPSDDEFEGSEAVVRGWREVVEEWKKQMLLAGPLVAIDVLQYSILIVSVLYVGRLGKNALSEAAMASSFATVTGFNILIGTGSTLDTFCGQAYGAKQYHMLGVYKQKAMVILTFLSIILAVLWACTGKILSSVIQEQEIYQSAGEYGIWMIPSIFAYGLFQSHVRFLLAQNIVLPMVVSTGITTLVHLLVCWVLVFKSGLGFKGAALANSLSYWLNVVLLEVYVRVSPSCKKTWTGFSTEAFHDLWKFIKLGIPSLVMFCLEFWAFQLTVMFSGRLPNAKLETSVLSISLFTASMVYMIPFGLGGAVSARVSNELGAGRPRAARLAAFAVIPLGIAEGLIIAVIMMGISSVWGYLFSNSFLVVNQVAKFMPLVAVSSMLDATQCVLSGTARGCGRQRLAAFASVGPYYIVGVPSALLLGFVAHIGGMGLWMGIILGLLLEVILLLTLTLHTDWEQEAERAKERVHDVSTSIR